MTSPFFERLARVSNSIIMLQREAACTDFRTSAQTSPEGGRCVQLVLRLLLSSVLLPLSEVPEKGFVRIKKVGTGLPAGIGGRMCAGSRAPGVSLTPPFVRSLGRRELRRLVFSSVAGQ